MRKPHIGTCVYCAKSHLVEDDHVLARSLVLLSERSDGVVKVKSCRECNRRKSWDEEYVKTLLSLHIKTGDTVEGEFLRESVRRQARHGKGPIMNMLRNSRPIELRSEAGLYLGDAYEFAADEKRLVRFACQIVRGLSAHHLGLVVEDGYDVDAFTSRRLRDLRKDVRLELEALWKPVLQRPAHQIGGVALRYKFMTAVDDAGASIWIIAVHKVVGFVVVVNKRDCDEHGVEKVALLSEQ